MRQDLPQNQPPECAESAPPPSTNFAKTPNFPKSAATPSAAYAAAPSATTTSAAAPLAVRLQKPTAPRFASPYARASFAAKAEQFCFYFARLSAPAANIFKQEALAAGAELAVSERAIIGRAGPAELIASRAQLERIAHKLALQPFGLAQIAAQLRSHLAAAAPARPAVMQIINVNFDSFYQFHGANWREAIAEAARAGVGYIDIGACSSAPGRRYPGEEAELAALAPVFAHVSDLQNTAAAPAESSPISATPVAAPAAPVFSCDTFSPAVAERAIAAGFGLINDISGSLDLAEMTLKSGACYVLMHSHPRYAVALCAGSRVAPDALSPAAKIAQIDEFFARRLDALDARGCDISRVVLDPGVGFAKTAAQNFAIIAHMAHFRHFGLPLLEGSSAKKSLGPPEIAPFVAANSAADIVRVHDAAMVLKLIDFKEKLNKF